MTLTGLSWFKLVNGIFIDWLKLVDGLAMVDIFFVP